jgi:hypothetical protein
VLGVLERWFVTRLLRPVNVKELEQLAAVPKGHSVAVKRTGQNWWHSSRDFSTELCYDVIRVRNPGGLDQGAFYAGKFQLNQS